MTVHSRLCKNCGNQFLTMRHNKAYCSEECKNAKRRKREAAEREKNGKKKHKNKSLRELAVEARKHGMSYGQYVAMKGL